MFGALQGGERKILLEGVERLIKGLLQAARNGIRREGDLPAARLVNEGLHGLIVVRNVQCAYRLEGLLLQGIGGRPQESRNQRSVDILEVGHEASVLLVQGPVGGVELRHHLLGQHLHDLAALLDK